MSSLMVQPVVKYSMDRKNVRGKLDRMGINYDWVSRSKGLPDPTDVLQMNS